MPYKEVNCLFMRHNRMSHTKNMSINEDGRLMSCHAIYTGGNLPAFRTNILHKMSYI